jgi:small-conductance mechanosensitive channel
MTLITVPIKTFSSETLVKLNITIGVHYNSDIKKTLQVITETINIFDFVQEKTATKAFVSNFKESYIETKAFFSFDPKCGIINEVAIGMINEKINENFRANGIIIPFNTLTVAFETSKDKEIVTKQLFSTPQQ